MKTLLLAAFAMFPAAGTASADQNCFWGEDRGVAIQAPYQSKLDTPVCLSVGEPRLSRTYGLNAWRRARLGRTGYNPISALFGARNVDRERRNGYDAIR